MLWPWQRRSLLRACATAEYAGAVRMAAQELRYQSHERLMRGFLGPEVFEGAVAIVRKPGAEAEQLRLVSG